MDVFSLVASLTLDSSAYESKLDEAKNKAGGIGSVLSKTAKIGTAALAGASVAAGALIKTAVDSYASYEQLVGGVETLFGDSAQKVIADANEAFKTAGMSANEYMETSIQSAASLINALDGDQARAADLMNMSITDVADNVNKMGTTMEAVQNAYRGFSRGNFTMLDNLALGFSGTKEGMQQLLDKAKEYEAEQGRLRDFSIDSYADIVEAIHVVQDNMGIAGTTAKEASETISGSLSTVKSAWVNLITSVANENADFDQYISNFVESVTTAAENILPRIEQAMVGIGKLVEGLAPVIADALPQLIRDVLPALVKAAVSVIQSFVDVLGDKESMSMIVQAAIDIVLILANALIDNVDKVVSAIVAIITAIAEALTSPENLEKLIFAAIEIIGAVVLGLLKAVPDLLAALGKVLVNILYTIGKWENDLIEAGKGLVKSIARGVVETAKDALKWGHDLIDNFIQGIKDRMQKVIDTVKGVAQKVKDFLGFSEPKEGPLANFHTFAPDMMQLFADGIKNNANLVLDQIGKSFDFGESIVQMGTNNQHSGATAASMQFQPVRVEATINLDGRSLWRGVVPAKNQYESFGGIPIIG